VTQKAWKIKFTPQQLDQMKSMYVEEKQTCHYIGGVYGISHSAVLDRLIEMGVEIRKQGRLRIYSDDEVHQISQYRAQGFTWDRIITMQQGGCEPHMRKRIRELDTMAYYNEEKVLYFASQQRGLHVAPDEQPRNTTLHRLTQDLLKRGLIEQDRSNPNQHRWFRITKAGAIRLLELQIEWRHDNDKDPTEQIEALARLREEA
jgi:hypothetical protein